MVRWSSCEKGHDLHPGTHYGLNAATCVLENKAFFGVTPYRSAACRKPCEWLTITDLVERHNYVRERQTRS